MFIASIKAQPIHGFASSNPYVCNIFSHGLLRNERLFEQDGGAGGGGGDPPAKTFTQADVDAIIGKRVAEATKKYAGFEDMQKQLGELTTLKTKLEELEAERAMAGKSAEEKAAAEAAKAAKRIETERAEAATKLTVAEKRAEAAEQKYKSRLISGELGAGLDSAKVLSSARAKAVKLFADEATVELDDNDNVASITYGGVAHKTVAEAAAAFLKDNDFLLAAQRGAGAGSPKPNGASGSQQSADGSAESLFAAGFAARSKQ